MKLFGNPQAKAAIDRMIATKKVPHALLFYGPQSVGKALFATYLAEQLAPPFAIRHYYPEGKGSIHSIESIRSLIVEATQPPKWLIIHEAHKMPPASANALLKTLEEPEQGVHLLLITHEIGHLLPTIRSRLSAIPFFEPTLDELTAYIEENHEGGSARHRALLARGSFARASKESDPTIDVALELLEGKSPQLEGIDADDLLLALFYWYRDLHLLRSESEGELLFFLDHKEALAEAAKRPIPPLEKVQKAIAKAHKAIQLHIRLDRALETFFLSI